MRLTKSYARHTGPAIDQPGGHQTFRISRVHGSIVPLLTLTPKPRDDPQGMYHRFRCVLNIGNELSRKQRKRYHRLTTKKPCNPYLLFLEGIKIDGITIVRSNFPVASLPLAYRANRSNVGKKIDLSRAKPGIIFPNTSEAVIVWYLNRSCALEPPGVRSLALKPAAPPLVDSLVILFVNGNRKGDHLRKFKRGPPPLMALLFS